MGHLLGGIGWAKYRERLSRDGLRSVSEGVGEGKGGIDVSEGEGEA